MYYKTAIVMKTIAATLLVGLISWAVSDTPIKTYRTDNAHSTMTVAGTSTLHDWEMKVESLNGAMDLDRYEDRLEIEKLELSVKTENLKSGKSKMDKNAYKALKYKDHPTIDYELLSVKGQKKTGNGQFELDTFGKLRIAGKSRNMLIPLKAEVQENGIILRGEVDMKMTDFNVEPPSVMMGTVNTGDDITISFSIQYK